MKKFLSSINFFAKALLLIILLAFGWAFVNVSNLVKWKKSANKDQGIGDLWGVNSADADVGGGPPPGPPISTPFLAYYDGQEYKLENDILFGRPKSYFSSFELGKQMYEEGMVTPDLYKITAPLKAINGKLSFQIQEIEPEESFFKWIELYRITHPIGTEVVVDSGFKKFYVFDKKEFEQSVILPEPIAFSEGKDFIRQISNPALMWDYSSKDTPRVFFEKDSSMDILFSGVRRGDIPYLIVKSWYRDWVMGDAEGWEERPAFAFDFGLATRNFTSVISSMSIAAAVAWILQRRGIDMSIAALPFFAGFHCFAYEYMDEEGNYQRANTFEPRSSPRSWKPNTEVIEFPREAVRSDNTVRMRITAAKRHAFGFVGLTQRIEGLHQRQFEKETLEFSRAWHNRLGTDVRASLMNRPGGEYIHTIPGDTVDIEFKAPEKKLKAGESETYLIKSSGFYTPLRREARRLAGNWQEHISDEARSRLPSLSGLKNYANK